MSARDDLVAEAIALLREQAAGYKDSPGGMRTRILGTELSQEHAKALLALLDAEPVAIVMIKGGAIVGSRMQVAMPDNPALRLYARPEASDE